MASPVTSPTSAFWLLLIASVLLGAAHAFVIFPVKSSRTNRTRPLASMRVADGHTNWRKLLSIPDLQVTSDYAIRSDWYFYTEFDFGTPKRTFKLLIETGTGLFWLTCDNSCTQANCDLNAVPPMYNIRLSSTGEPIGCSDEFCQHYWAIQNPKCEDNQPDCLQTCSADSDAQCSLFDTYIESTIVAGIYVRDLVQYHQVPNQKNQKAKANLTFGCATYTTAGLNMVSGAIGFGRSNLSMMSQLAALGLVRKTFAHCLDTQTVGGTGIFVIGDVEEPKVLTTAPFINDNGRAYKLYLESIVIGGNHISTRRPVVIDSGINFVYCPKNIFDQLDSAVFQNHPFLNTHTLYTDKCFWYTGSLDDGFPKVTLKFGTSSLDVFPHDYFYKYKDTNVWCFAWQQTDRKDDRLEPIFILGAMALSNKLIVYDLENEVLGWTEHNCSESIKVRDKVTQKIFEVHSTVSSATRWKTGIFRMLMLLTAAFI